MNDKIKCFFVIILFSTNVNAQFQDHIWYFGDNSEGIKFNFQNSTTSILNNQYTPYTSEGCSVVSNPVTGELFYYSDGIRVIDRNNNVMPNGTGLLGNSSSAQSGWSCSVPYECNKFYIFSNSTAYEVNPDGTIYYSVVDMNLPGNGNLTNLLGDVDPNHKNILLISNASEALVLIKGGKKYEFWLLSFQHNSSNIRVLKIDSLGIALTNIYNIGYLFRDARSIRYSPVSGKICITGMYGTDPIVICDFDNMNGSLSNYFQIPGSPFFNVNINYWGVYDSEWSSDGTKLYISFYRWYNSSSGGRLYQYDLNQPAVTPKLIFNNAGNAGNSGRGLQLGPDGKIYWLYNSSSLNSTRYIGVVNQPNQPGLSCSFDPLGLDMINDLGNTNKFPNFLIYNNQKPVAVNDSVTAPNCVQKTRTLDLLQNDFDPDKDTLDIAVLNVKYGSAVVLPDQTIQYTAPLNYSGVDTITYIISDRVCFPLSDTAIAIVCVHNICKNNPPVAQNDTLTACLNAGETNVVYPLLNDSDPDGDLLHFTISHKGKGSVTLLSDTSFVYTAPYLFGGIDTIAYLVCDSVACSLCDTAEISVCVSYQDIFIPNLITPNDDGFNDLFEIKGLYPNSTLEVYNQWGGRVYSSTNYKNKWKGEGESDGIYYYYFRDPIRKKEWKGWVQLVRQK